MTTTNRLYLLKTTALSAALLAAAPVSASVISGQLTNAEGEPVAGAIVRLTDVGAGVSESVYTDARGRYVLETGLTGELRLRFRAHYFADREEQVSLAGDDAALTRNVGLTALTTDREKAARPE